MNTMPMEVIAVTGLLEGQYMRDIAIVQGVYPPPAGPGRPGKPTLDIARRVSLGAVVRPSGTWQRRERHREADRLL